MARIHFGKSPFSQLGSSLAFTVSSDREAGGPPS
jgi:hypothetical protein